MSAFRHPRASTGPSIVILARARPSRIVILAQARHLARRSAGIQHKTTISILIAPPALFTLDPQIACGFFVLATLLRRAGRQQKCRTRFEDDALVLGYGPKAAAE